MSFDLFVGCFHHGERSCFRSDILGRAFGQFAISREHGCLVVCFGHPPEDNCYIYYDTESEMIDSFCVNRPKTDPRLFKAIFDVLRQGNMVLYMPSNCPPLVGNQTVLEHIPQDMIATLGKPKLLADANEIQYWIEKV